MLEKKELQLLDNTVTVSAKDGDISDGSVLVNAIGVEFDEEMRIQLNEEVDWADVDAGTLEEELQDAIAEQVGVNWPETDGDNWEAPRTVSTDSNSWKVLKALAENAPCTSSELNEVIDIGYSASSTVTTLKRKNLARTIGHNDDGLQVHVPTHVGFKELSTVYGVMLDDLTDYGVFKMANDYETPPSTRDETEELLEEMEEAGDEESEEDEDEDIPEFGGLLEEQEADLDNQEEKEIEQEKQEAKTDG